MKMIMFFFQLYPKDVADHMQDGREKEIKAILKLADYNEPSASIVPFLIVDYLRIHINKFVWV